MALDPQAVRVLANVRGGIAGAAEKHAGREEDSRGAHARHNKAERGEQRAGHRHRRGTEFSDERRGKYTCDDAAGREGREREAVHGVVELVDPLDFGEAWHDIGENGAVGEEERAHRQAGMVQLGGGVVA